MKKLVQILMFVFSVLVAVMGQGGGESASKENCSYPNELPTLKLYEDAKWNSLKPYVSTIDDITRVLGKPVPVYDELLRKQVAGYNDDPDWTVVIEVVGEGPEWPESITGRFLDISLYPKRRLSLIGADFSAFRSYTYRERDEEGNVYYDNFGLRYTVYAKDSPDGRFRAGDLKRIRYGPSEKDTQTNTQNKKRESSVMMPLL